MLSTQVIIQAPKLKIKGKLPKEGKDLKMQLPNYLAINIPEKVCDFFSSIQYKQEYNKIHYNTMRKLII